jgi:Lrp/AsnC family transcriptional regulator, leucine-responsive regulatory protein
MDEIDRRLLAALQANARIANAELARQVDLAPSSTLERVRRLEERGLIQGYRAVLDPQALGYRVQAVVMISLAGHQAGPIDAFEAQVRALPEVSLCLNVTGRYDYLLHVAVRDIDHLRQLVTRDLAAIGGVQKQETFLVLATAKQDQGLDLTEAADLDHAPAGRGGAPNGARPARRRNATLPPPDQEA